MARTVRDAKLETRAARSRLKAGETVHWRTLVPAQLHLGYRRRSAAAPGTWIARRYVGLDAKGVGRYKKTTLGVADDFRDADGRGVLGYADAQRLAHAAAEQGEQAPVQTCAATVGDVVESYILSRDRRETARQGRAVRSDASHRLRLHVLGRAARGTHPSVAPASVAGVRMADLAEADLRGWRAALPETLRGTTVRRLVNDLRAALNAGHAAHRAALAPGLPEIVKFGLRVEEREDEPSVSTAREDQILSDAEIVRLIGAAQQIDAESEWEGDLLRMVLVLTATGARFSQVARLRVADFQPENSRLMVPVSRKGNRKKEMTHVAVPIGEDVVSALRPAALGRAADACLLERWRVKQVGPARWERVERGRWKASSELARPFRLVRERAGLPAAIPYSLRHSSIVRGIRANLPIRLVAAAHDTSVGIVEKHYSKFIVSGLEAMLRTAIVPLVPAPGGNIVSMTARREAPT